ncbi:Predicted PurR-regulated permease PerM [Thermomonospora echinospora]|uniref:Predicted PurR-regulated permease PerM n=1 Tax=Thermomonospora echinospora TaxID=1992 RepID=A0A1H6D8X7_9ACTN|nr:AI-2E family transporter [Thermomonospora echinospora]SEG81669.1 Predicted PurR-regulated permease PerM [Thermomonospora echinospora]
MGPTAERMPPWLPRAFALAAAIAAASWAGLWLLARLKGLLILLLLSMFLALAIEPAVNRLAGHGWRRGPATGAILALILAATGLFFGVLGSLLVAQAGALVRNIPGYSDTVIGWVNHTFGTNLSQTTLLDRLPDLAGELGRHLSQVAGNVWGIGATAVGLLFQGLAVLLFTYYLTAQGPRFRRQVCAVLPPHRQREVLRAWQIALDKTGGYLYSRALLAVVSAAAHAVTLTLLDVPSALALAVWAGAVSQFIPTVGTYLAGVLPVLVALAADPGTALWVLAFTIAYQQVENYVLQPRITARALAMHPAVAFGLVLAGVAVLGPVGALLALPLGASLQVLLSACVRRYTVEEHPLTTEAPARR